MTETTSTPVVSETAETATQSRFRSPLLYSAIVGLIVIIGGNYGLWDAIHMTSDVFIKVADSISAILVLLGALNNPTSKNTF